MLVDFLGGADLSGRGICSAVSLPDDASSPAGLLVCVERLPPDGFLLLAVLVVVLLLLLDLDRVCGLLAAGLAAACFSAGFLVLAVRLVAGALLPDFCAGACLVTL